MEHEGNMKNWFKVLKCANHEVEIFHVKWNCALVNVENYEIDFLLSLHNEKGWLLNMALGFAV